MGIDAPGGGRLSDIRGEWTKPTLAVAFSPPLGGFIVRHDGEVE